MSGTGGVDRGGGFGEDPRAAAGSARLAAIIGDRLLLADGSTGTALETLAPEAASGGRIALLPLERPDIVEALHAAYFEAGSDMVETATFSASARDLAHFAEGSTSREFPGPGRAGGGSPGRDYTGVGFPGGAAELSYAVNRAAAAAAAKAARRVRGAGRRPGLVAGSVGPGDSPPSLGASTYAELLASYLPQARGLVDGGADLAIIETCQDPLQIKAAIAALRSPKGGRGLPFIVSATVDNRGRMLAGADIAAFTAIVAPFGPLALGLNCSGGPDELARALEELAALSPCPLCLMPNAGLPRSVDGRTSYPFGPELFAEKVEALARRFGIAIAGGCCGTTPAHIAALHARLSDRPKAFPRPAPRPALSSLYQARYIDSGLFKIGERANSAGSAAFAALLDADNFEGMADKALAQEESGASAIDLHLSHPGREEAEDLKRLVGLVAPSARAAISLDSGDPEVLGAALPLVGGRPLLNSTSLEDPAQARRVFSLAAEFGAAVVCLAMDGAGPARAVADKVRVCRALYDMATVEFGLQPQALLFDPLTFTIAAGGDASATIEGIAAVKEACPGALTVLGVGNVSYGLPKTTRSAVTSLFLEAAVGAGLDAAIMDTAGIPDPSTIEPSLKAAAAQALNLEKRADSLDPLDALLAWAADKGKSGDRKPPKPATLPAAPETPASPASALAAALSRGDAARSETAGLLLAEAEGADRLTSVVTASMAEAGRLWNEGLLSLPLVLRTAEAAKRALSPLAAKAAENAKGNIVMATVKGDLHDIGKNIVAAILACSGWHVVDLGTDVRADAVVEAARDSEAVAVGLSGLLTRSLSEMRNICEALHAGSSKSLVLCGGAAVEPSFIAREVEPKHPGLVLACADAFDAVRALDAFTAAGAEKGRRREPAADGGGGQVQVSRPSAPLGAPAAPRTSPAYVAPFLGSSAPLSIPFDELLPLLERKVLFASRWGYRREDYPAAEKELELLLPEARQLAEPKALYGHFACRRTGKTALTVDSVPSGLSFGPSFDLPFPTEKGGLGRSIADYFSPGGDRIAFFAVTAGPGIANAARALKEAGQLEAYWRLHGFGSALAEAAAQWIHDRISAELVAAGADTRGHRQVCRRYSFGFPACPGIEYQDSLLALLGASRIGVSATPGHQLDPEHSVTAFVVARPDAVYLNA